MSLVCRALLFPFVCGGGGGDDDDDDDDDCKIPSVGVFKVLVWNLL